MALRVIFILNLTLLALLRLSVSLFVLIMRRLGKHSTATLVRLVILDNMYGAQFSYYGLGDFGSSCISLGNASFGSSFFGLNYFGYVAHDSLYGLGYFGLNCFGSFSPLPPSPPSFFVGFMPYGKLGEEGEPDPLGVKGIWHRRMVKGEKVSIRMKFYRPTDPKTELQQANRAKFAAAMSAWGSLTENQKSGYTKRAKKRGMNGWGLFIREYYQNN